MNTLRTTLTIATCALATACSSPSATTTGDTPSNRNTKTECLPGDLTAAITESTAPNNQDKLFRLTFSAADKTTSCYLSGPPQNLVFRDKSDAKLPVTVTTDDGGDKPQEILVDESHQAEAYLKTPAADATTAAARADFTMPSRTSFTLAWPSPVGTEVTVTPVTNPVS
jgi:hypothetical protein